MVVYPIPPIKATSSKHQLEEHQIPHESQMKSPSDAHAPNGEISVSLPKVHPRHGGTQNSQKPVPKQFLLRCDETAQVGVGGTPPLQ